jgi:hypothetical protein
MTDPFDIVEILENLNVEAHQQAHIDAAVDEIVSLRRLKDEHLSILKEFYQMSNYMINSNGNIAVNDWIYLNKIIERYNLL